MDNVVLGGLWIVLKAALLLAVAFVVAAVAKMLAIKLIGKTRLNSLFEKADLATQNKAGGTKEYVGKLVYFLVFLLFVPGIFSILGVSSVAAPILGLLNTIWGYVPNVLAAVIILVVGLLVAKLVRQLLIPVFNRIKVDELQKKAGIEVNETGKLSVTIAYIIYVLIVIPVIIIALQALNIKAITDPAISMLSIIFGFIPNIIVAVLIIFIGTVIGRFAGQIVKRLIASTGIDSKMEQLEGRTQKIVISRLAGTIVNIVIIIFFTVEGFSILKLGILSEIGTTIIAYMPRALAAVIIFVLAMIASSLAEKALRKGGFKAYAVLARIAILALAAFMILNQLGIAPEIVNSAFIMIVAALAIAFAIAFGIGGREFAAGIFRKLSDQSGREKDKEE